MLSMAEEGRLWRAASSDSSSVTSGKWLRVSMFRYAHMWNMEITNNITSLIRVAMKLELANKYGEFTVLAHSRKPVYTQMLSLHH